MSKKVWILAAVLAAAALGGYGYYRHLAYLESPEHAMVQLERAFFEHDIERFNKFVDLDSVLNKGIDSMLEEIGVDPAEDQSEMPPERGLAHDLAAGFTRVLKPFVVSEARERFEKWLVTGKAPEAAADGDAETLDLAILGVFEYKGVADIRHEGKSAWATTVFTHKKYGKDIVIELFLRQAPEGHMRVVEVTNFGAVAGRLDSLEREYRIEQNKKARAELDAALKMVEAQKRTSAERWVIDRKAHFWLTLKNEGGRKIEGVEGVMTVTPIEEPENVVTLAVKVDAMELAPSDEKTYIWTMDVSMFNKDQRMIYGTPLDKMTLVFTSEKIFFEDGETLELPYRMAGLDL